MPSPQQPPEPVKPPQTPLPQPTVSQTSKVLQQGVQTLQQAWQRLRPVLIAQSINILRLTIRVLESSLAKLEALSLATPKPATVVKPNTAPNKVPSAADEGAKDPLRHPSAAAPENVTAKTAAEDSNLRQPATASLESAGQPTTPGAPSLLPRWQMGWSSFLSQIRSRLPLPWSQKLSNPVLTGVIAGTLVLLIWTTSAILPGGTPSTISVPSPEPSPGVSVPPELVAPVPPTTKLAEPESVGPPPPTVQAPPLAPLTPEQQLTVKLQEQVAEVGNQYVDGLVQFLQVDFAEHQLRVKLNDGWYSLSSEQQDDFVNEILQQAQEVNLNKLEVTSRKGALLARNPLVGKDMVVLLRKATSSLTPETSAQT